MPFQTPYPYGTAGGYDDPLEPQIPERWRLAIENSVVVYLHINGVLTEKDRQNVEDVIRVLDLTGVAIVAVIIRDDGTIIDNAVGDINAGDGLAITLDAPGVVTIRIPVAGITAAMLTDLSITAAKIANDTITAAQLAADSVGNSELAPNAVTNTEVAAGAAIAQSKLALSITNAEINAAAAIAKSKLAALNIVNADVDAAAAIAQSKLALAITNAQVAAGANIDGSKIADNSIAATKLIGGGGGSLSFVGGASATWDPASVSGNGVKTTTTVTVTGAAVGDLVLAYHDQMAGFATQVSMYAYVSAANTVTVSISPIANVAMNLASGTLSVIVLRV